MCKFRPHGSTCLSRRKSLIFRLQCCAGWRAVQYRKSFLIASHFNFLVKAYVLFIFGLSQADQQYLYTKTPLQKKIIRVLLGFFTGLSFTRFSSLQILLSLITSVFLVSSL